MESSAEAQDGGRPAGTVVLRGDMDEPLSIRTRPRRLARTYDLRKLYTVDANGGGHSSAMIRKMSANSPWNRYLRHRDRDVAPMPHHLRTDLGQLLLDCSRYARDAAQIARDGMVLKMPGEGQRWVIFDVPLARRNGPVSLNYRKRARQDRNRSNHRRDAIQERVSPMPAS